MEPMQASAEHQQAQTAQQQAEQQEQQELWLIDLLSRIAEGVTTYGDAMALAGYLGLPGYVTEPVFGRTRGA